jgi:cytochrome c oxidase subunit II
VSEHATPETPEGAGPEHAGAEHAGAGHAVNEFDGASEPQIHVERWEGIWIRVSLVMVVVFVTCITIAAVAWNITVPGRIARVDPNNLDAPGSPFANPGLREIAPGKYEAWMVAQAWMFTPSQITVPQGAEVTFYVTSRDIQHGFRIMDTNANVMLLPGQVSRVVARFKEPGTYNIICHEYCGLAHQTMYGQVIVEPASTEAAATESVDSTN